MSDQILVLDLRLMLLRHGRQKIMQALAHLDDKSIDQIEKELTELATRQNVKRPRASATELFDRACAAYPNLAIPLRELGIRYSNRIFLPTLREVQRFIDRLAGAHKKLKSREAAVPALLKVLTDLRQEELSALLASDARAAHGDYALLARAIMGKPAKPSVMDERTHEPK